MNKPPIIWINFLVLTLTPIIAILCIPAYSYFVGFGYFEWGMFLLFMILTGLSITAGYHRLWAHQTYIANWFIRLLLALFGAAALQNSILHWSADHRRHHKFVDDIEKDPYCAKKGLWFSHIGWILRDYEAGKKDYSNVFDLKKDKIVMWQHKYYLSIAIFMNTFLLLAIGYLNGKLLGTFLLAGILRIVLNHHFTFFINSLAHYSGKQPYSLKNTAIDSPILAFLTYGEGYHNFHHRFQMDYRNGIKWWQFDPTKWFIRFFSFLGLTSNLKKIPRVNIEKAKIETDFIKAMEKLESNSQLTEVKSKLENYYNDLVNVLSEWTKIKKQWVNGKKSDFKNSKEFRKVKKAYLEYSNNLKAKKKAWKALLKEVYLTQKKQENFG